MATRVSGMISGMDTESIVQQLVEVRQKKVDAKVKKKTTLQWKQDAWAGLNTKLKGLMSTVSNMRLTGDYVKKTTKSSNSDAVSVLTSDNAVYGTQSMRVESLAKTGYLTGGKLKSGVNASTKLDALINGGKSDDEKVDLSSGSLNLKIGNKDTTIDLKGTNTIGDLLGKLQDQGLNASFDVAQNRIFISSKSSGEKNNFTLTANDAAGAQMLAAMGLQSQESLSGSYATDADGKFDAAASLALYTTQVNNDVESRANAYLKNYKSLLEKQKEAQEKLDELKDKHGFDDAKMDEIKAHDADYYKNELETNAEAIKAKKAEIDAAKENGEDTTALESELTALEEEKEALTNEKSVYDQNASLEDINAKINEIETSGNIAFDAEGEAYVTDAYKTEQKGLVEAEYVKSAKAAFDQVKGGAADTNFATKVEGKDAVIYLNNAKFTSSSNTFDINGLTITANRTTAEGEEITLSTERDTDGIYNMIKDFFKQYNELVNEMDKLFNAESSKGYEPLTDDEKESMSEKEIEEWEKKIKDSVLRRDEELGNVNNTIQNIMLQGFQVGGKTRYLSDFGINTLNYFVAPDNEKHAYHIDGNSDDENSKNNTDKLKNMIAKNPDDVISFFSQLSQSLYNKMNSMSGSTDYSSYGKFYEDKRLSSEYKDYESKIKTMEEKLGDYEDKWYKKFSKMETALAKLQKNASSVTGIFGGGM